MTIKPVSAPPSAKRVAGNVDADNKEAQVVVVEQSVVSQTHNHAHTHTHNHRNVVIDGHGQVSGPLF